MILWLLQSRCIKKSCQIETTIPIQITVENLDSLKSIGIHFVNGQRVVLADIIYPHMFKDGVFDWEYKLYDLNPQPMKIVYRVNSFNSPTVEYEIEAK